jgi:hypothetical protein
VIILSFVARCHKFCFPQPPHFFLSYHVTISHLNIQGNSRVIMSPSELKMQPTLHFRKSWLLKLKYRAFFENVLWVAFSIPSGSLSLVNNPVYGCSQYYTINCIHLNFFMEYNLNGGHFSKHLLFCHSPLILLNTLSKTHFVVDQTVYYHHSTILRKT